MKVLKYPFHSLLLSVYSVLHVYAHNVVFIPFQDTLRFSALSLGFAVFFLICFRLILRGWARAGVLCSLIMTMFFAFGQVANCLGSWTYQRTLDLDITLFTAIWLLLFIVLAFVMIRARLPEMTTFYLNIASLILIAFPLTTIFSRVYMQMVGSKPHDDVLADIRGETIAEAAMGQISQSDLPGIYYLIPDGYGRADVLSDLYDYDNSSFISALEERGFYVASKSHSNYLSTPYSLNTSMNLIYFHDFPASFIRNARFNLRTNYVTTFLREQGYKIVVFDSGLWYTTDQYADYFLSPPKVQFDDSKEVNIFEQLMLKITMGLFFKRSPKDGGPDNASDSVISSVNRELSQGRARLEYIFERLPDFSSLEGQYFVFAHVCLPHFPFLYGPNGEDLKYQENLQLCCYEVETDQYVEYYNYQVDYLNQVLLETIDRILMEAKKPVVIILQSDHGDDRFLDWDDPTTQGVHGRSAILNAIYYSDGEYGSLYPSITPVNTFRVTLNHFFGTGYPLLQDQVFFHLQPLTIPINKVPQFMDACTYLNLCMPGQVQ